MFSPLCLSVCPHLTGEGGGTLSGQWGRGYPIQLMERGVPHPSWWVPPSQVQTGGTPSQSRWGRYPPPPSRSGPRSGWEGSLEESRTGWGIPPCPGLDGTPPPPVGRQSSIARTCYAAGGMPLVFTQEDIFVLQCFPPLTWYATLDFEAIVFLLSVTHSYKQWQLLWNEKETCP